MHNPSKYEEAANRLDAGFAKIDDAEEIFIDTPILRHKLSVLFVF